MLYLGKNPKSRKTQTPGMNIGKTLKQRRRMLYLGKLRKKLSPQGIQVFSQAILADPTEDTERSEQTIAEQVEVTHTIDITEVVTGIPKPTLEATCKESERSTTTPPGSPQRKNPEAQINSRDNTEVNAEQAVKRTHKYPETNNSIVYKIFSVFRQAKESLNTIPM